MSSTFLVSLGDSFPRRLGSLQHHFYGLVQKLYRSLEEIQADLDEFMARYSAEGTNQGRYCHRRTPMHTYIDGLPLYQRYVFKDFEEREAGQESMNSLPGRPTVNAITVQGISSIAHEIDQNTITFRDRLCKRMIEHHGISPALSFPVVIRAH